MRRPAIAARVAAAVAGAYGPAIKTAVHRSPDHLPAPVDHAARAATKGRRAKVLWLTGLSGAGKTTIAQAAERKLAMLGHHAVVLDGDDLRRGLCRDLGFSDADRAENVRRAGEVARLMADAGLIVIAALISPFRADRAAVRATMGPGEFAEVFVDAPLSVAEARDPKGLYARARAGLLPDFTGVGSAYELPLHPELRLDTVRLSPSAAADLLAAEALRR